MARGIFTNLSGNVLVREGIKEVQGRLALLGKESETIIRQNRTLMAQNEVLIRQGARIMAGITEENAAIQTLTDNFTKYAGDVQTQVAKLQTAIDQGQDTQPFIDRLNSLSKAVTDADGALNPATVVTKPDPTGGDTQAPASGAGDGTDTASV